jgi:hypothetical protein
MERKTFLLAYDYEAVDARDLSKVFPHDPIEMSDTLKPLFDAYDEEGVANEIIARRTMEALEAGAIPHNLVLVLFVRGMAEMYAQYHAMNDAMEGMKNVLRNPEKFMDKLKELRRARESDPEHCIGKACPLHADCTDENKKEEA